MLTENERSIAAFTMFGHGLFHWFEMAIPILLVKWIQSFTVPVNIIGVIIAVGFVPIGMAALPGGLLVDQYGPARVVMASIAGMSFGFGTLAFAPSIYGLGLALGVWGVFAGIYHPAGMSVISTGAEHRGTVFAYHGIAGNIGTALGPFVAASLLLVFEWRIVIVMLAVPGLLAFLYGVSITFDPTAAVATSAGRESDNAPTQFRTKTSVLLNSLFPVVLAIIAFDGLVYRGLTTFLPQILRELPTVPSITFADSLVGINVGDYIFVGVLVVGIAGQWVGGKLSERGPPEKGLIAGFGILAVLSIGFVPIVSRGLVTIVLLAGMIGFFLFFVQPMYQVAVAVYTPVETRGLSYGLTYLAEFGIGAGSIALGGFLLESFSLQSFFLAMSGFAFAASALAVGLLRNPK